MIKPGGLEAFWKRIVSKGGVNSSKLSFRGHMLILCSCQILVFFDRGLVSGFLSSIPALKVFKGTDNEMLFESFLSGSFMLGYMTFAPIFAKFGQRSSLGAIYSMICGLLVWMLASLLTCVYIEGGFGFLIAMRALSGIGESGFVAMAPPIIDDAAPEGKKGVYVALFYMLLFVGFALGNVSAGMFSDFEAGRILFLAQAIMMGCVVSGLYFNRSRFSVPRGTAEETRIYGGLLQQILLVLRQKHFAVVTLGYGMVVYLLGAYAFWMPSITQKHFGVSRTLANTGIAITMVLSGIIGTIMGGVLMDRVEKRKLLSLTRSSSMSTVVPDEVAEGTSSVEVGATRVSVDLVRLMAGCQVSFLVCAIAYGFTVVAMTVSSVYVFFALMFVAEVFILATTAPANGALMCAVPHVLRSQSMAVSLAISHLVGDFPSPVIFGTLVDRYDIMTAVQVTNVSIFVAAALFFVSFWKVRSELNASCKIQDSKQVLESKGHESCCGSTTAAGGGLFSDGHVPEPLTTTRERSAVSRNGELARNGELQRTGEHSSQSSMTLGRLGQRHFGSVLRNVGSTSPSERQLVARHSGGFTYDQPTSDNRLAVSGRSLSTVDAVDTAK